MRERVILIAAFLFVMSPSAKAQKKQPSAIGAHAHSGAKWARQTLARMSLDEKLGQMVMVYYWGRFTSTEDPEFRDLVREVQENHVGGIILQAKRTPTGVERSQVYPTAALSNELQSAAKIPLLVAADFENGTAMRLADGTSLPSAMAVAATSEVRDAFTMGKITAIEARAAGVNWIFAPVSDVNDNPDNPIINTRSFGEDPVHVAECVAEFVRGVQENGAMATAKHFPGHGNVSTDSHISVPVVTGDLAEMNRVELVPFRAAISAGVGAVMSGHLIVPALEPDKKAPATLSSRILTDLLRKKMGFGGIEVTDALDMAGVTEIDSPPNVAVRAISAGIDVLLIPPNPGAAIAALKEAVNSGQLPMTRINEAVLRILNAKARLNLDRNRFVDLERLNTVFGSPKFKEQAQDIADRGITLVRDNLTILPLDTAQPKRILLVIVSGDPDPYPGVFIEQELRERAASIQTVRVDTNFIRADSVALPAPDTYDVAIAAVFVRVADRKGTVALPAEEISLLNHLIGAGKPTIVASLGSPYLVAQFPEAKTWLAAFGTQDVIQRAMARAIFGLTAIGGELPVTVPGVAKIGDGLRVAANPMTLAAAPAALAAKLQPAFAMLDRAVAEHAFPGGVLAIGRHNQLIEHAFGRMSYAAKSHAVKPDTIYDVASLTKPIVTTTAVMKLVAEHQIDLDAPISRYLAHHNPAGNPDWLQKITVRELLLHTSGLPAHREFYKTAKSPGEWRKLLYSESLVSVPGAKVEYSDLGFIILGDIVERLTGMTLARYARENIFDPLGMEDSLFNPPRSLSSRIAPTQTESAFRKQPKPGEVDDDNAFALGGTAGHAGLFSTTSDLAVFAQMMLNGGIYAQQRILPRATVEQFTARVAVGDSARTLGWDVPTGESSSGHYLSIQSYGHNGFTGTSIWIDPQKDLFVILLTNRVHPSAANDRIRSVRPAINDAILKSLGFADGGNSR